MSFIPKFSKLVNRHLTNYRYFIFLSLLLLITISIIAYFVLGVSKHYEFDWTEFFFVLWAILSIIVGSVVFLQLEEKKVSRSYSDFMQILIELIESAEGELLIVTPNVNIGQTQVQDKYEDYQKAILTAVKKKIFVAFSIWDFEDCSNIVGFNLHSKKYIHIVSEDKFEGIAKHLDFVESLLNKRFKKDEELLVQKGRVNKFLKELAVVDTVTFNSMNSDEEGKFFLIYNGKKLHIASCEDSSNIVEGYTIDSVSFIKSILPHIKSKYFPKLQYQTS